MLRTSCTAGLWVETMFPVEIGKELPRRRVRADPWTRGSPWSPGEKRGCSPFLHLVWAGTASCFPDLGLVA